MAQAIGNVTEWYQNCYNGSVDSLSDFYAFIINYESLQNYIVFWLLNLAVQAIQMVDRIKKLQQAIADNDLAQVIYMYALLTRVYFFFEYDAKKKIITKTLMAR